ncbi:MAG: BatA and WFA domain-containing protein [Thermoguttaceae bacterium]|nr:BatA and WFA domain-containing protein [Thermoguttaceae bacterium]
MALANSAALWTALLVPVVVAAFLIRRKTRRRVVSALFLWEDATGGSVVRSRSFKIRDYLALAVALAIVVSLIAAAAEPVVGNADPETTIVLVDNSRSASATDARGKTRLDEAKARLKRLIANKREESEILIATTAGAPTIVSGFSRDASALLDVANRIEGSELPCAARESVELARFFRETRGESASALFLSDGCFEGATDLSEEFRKGDVRFERVGEARNNVALLSFSARRSPLGDASCEATLEVANFGDEPVSLDVEIGLNEVLVDLIPLALESNERVSRAIKFEATTGGVASARLLLREGTENALASDDEILVDLPDFPEFTIRLFGSDDRYLRAVFAAQPNVRTILETDLPETLGTNDLLVVCGDVPAKLPEGKIALVNPTSDAPFFSVAEESIETEVESGVVESPLTAFIDLRGIELRNVREIEPREGAEFEVLARSPESPVFFEVKSPKTPNSRIWALNFSCSADSVALRTVFPILFANLIGAARGFDDARFELDEPISRAESDLRSPLEGEKLARETLEPSPTRRFALWKYFAVFALALSAVEYYCHCRRKL